MQDSQLETDSPRQGLLFRCVEDRREVENLIITYLAYKSFI